ncbi:hypothetical protein PI126_g22712 [Phytophthora idaei]|nr:hypothetical protein PI126_g22712 [Phytophthora idaei]
MSYYRHVKNWLLDTYPKHRATIEKKLLKMGQTPERRCLKRVEGGMIKKAPACTKEDLRILMDGLYYDAAIPKDYQDAALLALMWYAFGRASDLGSVVKGNLSVSADGVVFVRRKQLKNKVFPFSPTGTASSHVLSTRSQWLWSSKILHALNYSATRILREVAKRVYQPRLTSH